MQSNLHTHLIRLKEIHYTNRINPIVAFPGQGVVLYGDKTALSYASAFDRINVRRLFLTIERVIGGAAKSQLFEQNDEAQRSLFFNIVEPYMRDVQGRRGVTDFLVKCDETTTHLMQLIVVSSTQRFS